VNKKQFEIILDQTTEDWFLGTDRPIITGKNRGKYETRPIEQGGFPHVIKIKPSTEFCVTCCRTVEDKRTTKDIRTGQIRCSCGRVSDKNQSILAPLENLTNK
jgi:hypothetical protein